MAITLNGTGSGFNRSVINDNFSKIEEELNNNVLRREAFGSEDNAMRIDLDMNSNRILNLPRPESAFEPARLIDLTSVVSGLNLTPQASEVVFEGDVDYTADDVETALEKEAELRVNLTERVDFTEGSISANNISIGALTTDVQVLQNEMLTVQDRSLGNVADISSLSNSKADRDQDATENNVAVFDEDGNPIDSGFSISEVGSSTTFTSETVPTGNLTNGMTWYNPALPAFFVYYEDEDSGQWVEESQSELPEGSVSPAKVEDIDTRLETLETLSDNGKLYVSVLDYGAYNDPAGITDQTSFFELAAQAANNDIMVYVPPGFFKLNSATTTSANWLLAQDAQITGIGGLSPTFERDTTRLTGKTIQLKATSSWNTLRVGDPSYQVQKLTNKSFSAEVEGHSAYAAGGLLGTTFASARDVNDASCHAVGAIAVNDSESVTKGVWASYFEAYTMPGVDGNAFCLESTSFNANSTNDTDDTPNRSVVGRGGLTYNLWLTTGGDNAFGQEMYNTTAAIGILGKESPEWGAKYKHGIIIKANALEGDDGFASPTDYKTSWWEDKGAGDIRRSYVTGRSPLSTGRVVLGCVNGDGETYTEWQTSPSSASFVDDNVGSLGESFARYSVVYSASGTINTSDEREKEQIRDLSEAEKAVATELKSNIKAYKWRHSVEEKGDGARWHFGIMAQTVQNIFESHGLDGFEYGVLCYDEEDGGEQNRYGIRYDELMCFIIASI